MNDMYVELANAIICQAAWDYMFLLEKGLIEKSVRINDRFISIKEITRFFNGKWYSQLTTLDHNYLIRMLKKYSTDKSVARRRTYNKRWLGVDSDEV